MKQTIAILVALVVAQASGVPTPVAPPPGGTVRPTPDQPVVAPVKPPSVDPNPVFVGPPSGPSAGPALTPTPTPDFPTRVATLEANLADIQTQMALSARVTALEAEVKALKAQLGAAVVNPGPPVAPTPSGNRGFTGQLNVTVVSLPPPFDTSLSALTSSTIASDVVGVGAVYNVADVTETTKPGTLANAFALWTARNGIPMVYLTDQQGNMWAQFRSPTRDDILNRIAAIRQGRMR